MTQSILEIGANIEARTNRGYTPFLNAVQNGDINTILLLLDLGADAQATAKDGSTALHVAVKNGNLAALELLLNKGDTDVNSPANDMTVGIPESFCLVFVFLPPLPVFSQCKRRRFMKP
jgi:ankyrin repeat protein